jgi:hypothetical protein
MRSCEIIWGVPDMAPLISPRRVRRRHKVDSRTDGRRAQTAKPRGARDDVRRSRLRAAGLGEATSDLHSQPHVHASAERRSDGYVGRHCNLTDAPGARAASATLTPSRPSPPSPARQDAHVLHTHDPIPRWLSASLATSAQPSDPRPRSASGRAGPTARPMLAGPILRP